MIAHVTFLWQDTLFWWSLMMENRFAHGTKAAASYTLCRKHRFEQLFFFFFLKAGAVTLMNISICIWRLKSALLVKNAWFHNSSLITILTHSNKGSPLQLHQSGAISKRGHAELAFCIQATSPISLSCWFQAITLPSNVLFMAICEHHLSGKLLLPRAWVLASVVRAKTGGGGEDRGVDMAVVVLHQ